MTQKLFQPFRLGELTLPNRLVMAPMTRSRAGAGNVPTDLNVEYYVQRASAGLIISEASQVATLGIGYASTPGIHSKAQVEGWKKVTEGVHRAGGRIFLQLWHVGRVAHPLFTGGRQPVSSSAVAAPGKTYTPEGPKPFETPRALETGEIPAVVEEYRQGAANAKAAGFDGVEIHAANGYLPDQFLRDGVNRRTDDYGGSPENRARFLKEVTQAAIDVWGADRVGVRLSPSGSFNGMSDSDPVATFSAALRMLDGLEVIYAHIIEGNAADERHGGRVVPTAALRPHFQGALMVAGELTKARAEAVLEKGEAELVAFARLFLANPDLPRRFRDDAPLNAPDSATFYGGAEKGYVDYPALAS